MSKRKRIRVPRRTLPLRGRHLDYAGSTRFEHSFDFFKSKSLEELDEIVEAEFKKYNYRVQYRERGNATGMTLAFTLYLTEDFKDRPLIDQVALKWHERLHMEQWRRGHMLRYLDDRWRWSIETPAHREQYRFFLAQGVSKKKVENMVNALPAKFASNTYYINRIPFRNMELHTRDMIWSKMYI